MLRASFRKHLSLLLSLIAISTSCTPSNYLMHSLNFYLMHSLKLPQALPQLLSYALPQTRHLSSHCHSCSGSGSPCISLFIATTIFNFITIFDHLDDTIDSLSFCLGPLRRIRGGNVRKISSATNNRFYKAVGSSLTTGNEKKEVIRKRNTFNKFKLFLIMNNFYFTVN